MSQEQPPRIPIIQAKESLVNSASKKNMAYINITGEGAKAVGPIGLKKAEKDLILRRYKYTHHPNQQEAMQRVQLIYGGGSGVGNSNTNANN